MVEQGHGGMEEEREEDADREEGPDQDSDRLPCGSPSEEQEGHQSQGHAGREEGEVEGRQAYLQQEIKDGVHDRPGRCEGPASQEQAEEDELDEGRDNGEDDERAQPRGD
jgi:hypothetical protein